MADLPQVTLGLVGFGGYGAVHLKYIKTFQQVGLCRLVAAADPSSGRLTAITNALRLGGCDIYEDASLLLERNDIDAVIIASSIPYHSAQTIAALNAGKHVLVEKPPCATIKQYHQMSAAQAVSNKLCAVGFHHQTNPALHWLRAELHAGLLGRIETVWSSVRWPRNRAYYERSPWAGRLTLRGMPVFDGPATNALAHMVQLAVTVGGAPKQISGKLWRARPIESYDTAYLSGVTETGTDIRVVFTHVTTSVSPTILHVRGEKGHAQLDYDGNVRVDIDGETPRELRMPCDCNAAVILDFLQSVKSPERTPRTPLSFTRGFLDMVHGAYQSGGGIESLPASIVEVSRAGSQDEIYKVRGLDEQMDAFAASPKCLPPLLTSGGMATISPIEIDPSPFGC